jgi:hypothetical protein
MPTLKELTDTYTAAARREVGVMEEPLGSNWGTTIHAPHRGCVAGYCRTCGYKSGVYWCLCFATTVALWACEDMASPCPLPITGDCDLTLAWAKKKGCLFTEPQIGDIGLVVYANDTSDAHHAFIVVGVNRDTSGKAISLVTVEGNSNNGGGSNGIGVFLRGEKGVAPRPISSVLRFVRWLPLAADMGAVAAGDKPQWKVALGGKVLGEGLMDGAGTVLYPVRNLVDALFSDAEIARNLKWDHEGNRVAWEGKPIPAPVTMRDGRAWLPVRPAAGFFGLTVTPDAAGRVVNLTRAKPAT